MPSTRDFFPLASLSTAVGRSLFWGLLWATQLSASITPRPSGLLRPSRSSRPSVRCQTPRPDSSYCASVPLTAGWSSAAGRPRRLCFGKLWQHSMRRSGLAYKPCAQGRFRRWRGSRPRSPPVWGGLACDKLTVTVWRATFPRCWQQRGCAASWTQSMTSPSMMSSQPSTNLPCQVTRSRLQRHPSFDNNSCPRRWTGPRLPS